MTLHNQYILLVEVKTVEDRIGVIPVGTVLLNPSIEVTSFGTFRNNPSHVLGRAYHAD
jgi:hypothetical protein